MDLLLFVPAFLGFLYASYTDMKSKLVPDNLVYGLIGLGLLIRIGQGLLLGFDAVSFTLATFLLYSAVGYVFYRFRGWADGDFGMFVAVSLFLTPATNAPWPAFFSYISNLGFVGVAYGFVYLVYLAVQPKFFKHWMRSMTPPAWFFSVALALCGAFASQALHLSFVPGLVLGFFTYPLSLVSASLNTLMKRRVAPSELEAGDWVLEDIRVGNKTIITKDNPGLSRAQITLLEGLYSKKKISKILIKDGIPFIPVFFLAYLASSFYGDLIYGLVKFALV